ncbi:MAG TPA: iron-containing alcohol dehydrogenase [Fibrobacteria bacterium]|nr:iron-containing alcohol dehydrogenase [Fibrobacteria bacterium]HOX50942.1 iron-containing alcohol dehydrogenase [Fibrobacteria bacterium]
MLNFEFSNPTRLVFGRDTIARLSDLVPKGARVLLTYGGGSIFRNGVHASVRAALDDAFVVEFGGIEPNPRYETLMKAVRLVREKEIDFLLPVGGGSVLDGTKFIAAAVKYDGPDAWEILRSNGGCVKAALPLGAVLTLPATGSEANGSAVISRDETTEKLGFWSELVYPRFSILDPATTFTLDARQTGNGVVDAFVHTTEQYVTVHKDSVLQDRFAEGILSTLIEEGPKVLASPSDYASRANVMWAATMALQGAMGAGLPGDWASHGIGHELTAFYGLDHARTLAVVLPGVWRHQLEMKKERLAKYGARVWGLTGEPAWVASRAIELTEAFFESMGVPTRLSDHGIDAVQAGAKVRARFAQRGTRQGENGSLSPEDIEKIIVSRA